MKVIHLQENIQGNALMLCILNREAYVFIQILQWKFKEKLSSLEKYHSSIKGTLSFIAGVPQEMLSHMTKFVVTILSDAH